MAGDPNAPIPFYLSTCLPSQAWLNNPGYIDGGVNPPVMYYTTEDMQEHVRLAERFGMVAQLPPAGASPGPGSPSVDPNDAASQQPAPSQAPEHTPGSAQNPSGDKEVQSGYATGVILQFTITQPAAGKAGDRGKMVTKTDKVTKTITVHVDEVGRQEFVRTCLAAHGLDKKYSPGVHRGPLFELSWTGSPGGVSNATTIATDAEYRIAVEQIKAKPKKTCKVVVQFDATTMQPWQVEAPQALALSGGDANANTADAPELQFGTHVPAEDSFTTEEMLHGKNIRELKTLHACQTHLGEHGEVGCCYVTPESAHTKLNNRKLKLWAAAWAAGTTMKHEPPNTVEFDGCRDGAHPIRPRGRTGPRPAPQTVATTNTPAAAGVGEIFALLTAAVMPAIIPMLQNMASGTQNTASGTSRRRRASTSDTEEQPGPKRRRSDGVPRLTTRLVEDKPAAMPSELGELDPCFAAFERKYGFNLEPFIVQFAWRSLTPDVIPLVPLKFLQDTTEYDVPEYILEELKRFCKGWVNDVQAGKGSGWVVVDKGAEGGPSEGTSRSEMASTKEGTFVVEEGKEDGEVEDDFVVVDEPDVA